MSIWGTGVLEKWTNFPMRVNVPDGCLGYLLIFDTPSAAQAFYGKNVYLIEFDYPAKEAFAEEAKDVEVRA